MTPEQRTELKVLLGAEAWKEARGLLEKCKPTEPDVEWLAALAEVETGAGNLAAAATLYEQVLELAPDRGAALYNSSLVLSDLGRHEDAMTSLEALIEIEGETAAVLNDLAFEYMECGHNVPGYLAACRAEHLAAGEDDRCMARLNAATALANMGRRTESRARLDVMLRDCTGACGEREAAQELRQGLDPRHPRRSVSG
jgi:tetratricopeptide (TPR) repeat protein